MFSYLTYKRTPLVRGKILNRCFKVQIHLPLRDVASSKILGIAKKIVLLSFCSLANVCGKGGGRGGQQSAPPGPPPLATALS